MRNKDKQRQNKDKQRSGSRSAARDARMMSSMLRIAIASVVLSVTISAASGGQNSGQPVLSGEGLPDAPGKDVTVRTCAPCHEARRAASVRLTRDGWAAVIEAMRARGAKVSD